MFDNECLIFGYCLTDRKTPKQIRFAYERYADKRYDPYNWEENFGS